MHTNNIIRADYYDNAIIVLHTFFVYVHKVHARDCFACAVIVSFGLALFKSRDAIAMFSTPVDIHTDAAHVVMQRLASIITINLHGTRAYKYNDLLRYLYYATVVGNRRSDLAPYRSINNLFTIFTI